MDIILTPQGDLFGNDGALQFDDRDHPDNLRKYKYGERLVRGRR